HRVESREARQPSRNEGSLCRSFLADTPTRPAWHGRWDRRDAIAATDLAAAQHHGCPLRTRFELHLRAPQCCSAKSSALVGRPPELVCCLPCWQRRCLAESIAEHCSATLAMRIGSAPPPFRILWRSEERRVGKECRSGGGQ